MKYALCIIIANVGLVLCNSNLCKLNICSPLGGPSLYNYFPLNDNRVEFQIRSAGGVRILLGNDYAPRLNPYYEITIGINGTDGVKLVRDGQVLVLKNGPLYDPKTFRRFVVTVIAGVVKLTTNIDMVPFEHRDVINVPMAIVGVAADEGVSAELLYDCRQFHGK